MSTGVRACARCKDVKSVERFHGKGRLCDVCRAADDAPKVTETEWQVTVVAALSAFGWSHMHVRRSRGRHGSWTTATSADGWPDITAMRGPHVLGIELKTDVGTPTGEQLEWLARFARIVGGRAWIIRPSNPEWDTFVTWLRDPSSAPRRHGW